jgi:hypothetical protein
MRKAITLTIPHDLGRAEARRRIDEGFANFAKHLGAVGGVSKTWTGDHLAFTASALGQQISGAVDVAEAAVTIEVLLPNLLAALANRLKGRLKTEGQILLEKK